MNQGTLEAYFSLVDQMSDLLTHRAHVTAEIRRLHAESRPLQQELLKQMTFDELNTAYEARLRAMTKQG